MQSSLYCSRDGLHHSRLFIPILTQHPIEMAKQKKIERKQGSKSNPTHSPRVCATPIWIMVSITVDVTGQITGMSVAHALGHSPLLSDVNFRKLLEKEGLVPLLLYRVHFTSVLSCPLMVVLLSFLELQISD